MTDYMILGAGAVGCVIGGMLAHAGRSVQLITRSAQLGEAVAIDGLRLRLPAGELLVHPQASQPHKARPAEMILVLTKSFDTEAAIEGIRPLITDETLLVTLQNGLGNGELLARLCPQNQIFHGASMLPAAVVRPGLVEAKDRNENWLGPLTGGDTRPLSQLAADLAGVGAVLNLQEDVRPVIWQKACFNIAMNAVNTLTDSGPGLVYDSAGLRQLVYDLMDEAILVAEKTGVTLDRQKVVDLIDLSCTGHRYHIASMLQDIRAGRHSEIDQLNGALLETAEQLGLDLPNNRVITALMRARQAAPAFWQGQPTD